MNSNSESKSRLCGQLKNLLTLQAGLLLLPCLAALALAFTGPVRAETLPAAIPFSDIGAKATAAYQGDALGITATADGARLRCGFQKLEGRATPEGLWLESTKPGGGKLRLIASSVVRGQSSVRSAMSLVTVAPENRAPLGAACPRRAAGLGNVPLLPELANNISGPPFYNHAAPDGAMASLMPGAQTFSRKGTVSVQDKLVRFTRPGLTEEYSVSVDGVRQDFVIAAPPAGVGELRVELALSGARAESAAGGARLTLEGSGRALAYSRLRAEDATGRELTAHLQVLSSDRLAVSVADANAAYPVRIDPTFSDADWVSFNPGMNSTVYALAVSGTNLYAGGAFTSAGGVPANGIAKWNGSAWSPLSSGMNHYYRQYVLALAVSGTNLYAGGYFTTAGGVSVSNIARWDGSTWSPLGSGVNDLYGDAEVEALAVSGTNLYVGGYFTTAGGVSVANIAKWDGNAWSALGSGMNYGVNALAVSGTNLYAGGNFSMAGGVPANYIAKWDGSAWSALGSGVNGANGWSGAVSTMVVVGTNLYAGGGFTTAGGVPANYIAKWDGSAWSALGSGMGGAANPPLVNALAVNGTNLYAGGAFTTAGRVPANYIAKWDGNAWSALGSGMNHLVYALAADGVGHLFVGGGFTLAGNRESLYIAKTVLGSAPTAFMSQQTQTAEAGATVHLTVDAGGDPPPAYHWYLNGTNILGCTSSDLLLTNILFSQSGTYTVVVTNMYGTVTSAPVIVNVVSAVARRPAAGVALMGQAGSVLNVDYANALRAPSNWLPLEAVTLASTSQYCFDASQPLPPQRYYRAWQTGTPGVLPSLSLFGIVPAITLTGSIGHSVRVDRINQFGPIDAWVTLNTVTLTNTSQLYFDVSAPGQPPRLYRIAPAP